MTDTQTSEDGRGPTAPSAKRTPDQDAAVDNPARSETRPSTADVAAAGSGEQPKQRSPNQDSAQQAEAAEAREQPAEEPRPSASAERDEQTPLLAVDASEQFKVRWREVQADFVDDPRSAVARADELVAEVMKRVAEEFARERSGLEDQWNQDGEASTEDLRQAFQRYRSFFSRLLSL
jgi:hypothetical protein